jgi:hypothetical protein
MKTIDRQIVEDIVHSVAGSKSASREWNEACRTIFDRLKEAYYAIDSVDPVAPDRTREKESV